MSAFDIQIMRQAIALARRAEGITSPNPLVGCVIVQDQTVISEGWHRGPGTDHAEVDALKGAGSKALGATAYVTLEPCNHYGNTPPCTKALVDAGIARVIYGAADPNPLASGGAVKLVEAGIEVQKVEAIVRAEAEYLARPWAHGLFHPYPYVYAKWAGSLDGRTATRTGESKWITGPDARGRGHDLRQRTDAIIVGVGTVLTDNPALDARPEGVGSSVSLKVLLDTHLRCPGDAKFLSSPGSALIFCGPEAPSDKVAELANVGAEVIPVSLNRDRVSLTEVLTILKQREVVSVMIEGGATLLGAAFDDGLVDEVWAFVAPMIIGGGQMAVAGFGPSALSAAVTLECLEVEKLGADFLIRGLIKRGAY